MTALALVQNEGVMSSPFDVIVIEGQVIAARQHKIIDGSFLASFGAT